MGKQSVVRGAAGLVVGGGEGQGRGGAGDVVARAESSGGGSERGIMGVVTGSCFSLVESNHHIPKR